jgi:hypothetical protein
MHKMKQTFVLLVLLFFVIGCGRPQINIEKELAVIRQYAEQYQPNPKRIDNLDMPPHEVTEALNVLSNSETQQHEPYVVLILLKIYRNHYEHGHQSYELRGGMGGRGEAKNPILKEYCRLVGLNPRTEEFLPSGHVYGWIEKHS